MDRDLSSPRTQDGRDNPRGGPQEQQFAEKPIRSHATIIAHERAMRTRPQNRQMTPAMIDAIIRDAMKDADARNKSGGFIAASKQRGLDRDRHLTRARAHRAETSPSEPAGSPHDFNGYGSGVFCRDLEFHDREDYEQFLKWRDNRGPVIRKWSDPCIVEQYRALRDAEDASEAETFKDSPSGKKPPPSSARAFSTPRTLGGNRYTKGTTASAHATRARLIQIHHRVEFVGCLAISSGPSLTDPAKSV